MEKLLGGVGIADDPMAVRYEPKYVDCILRNISFTEKQLSSKIKQLLLTISRNYSFM